MYVYATKVAAATSVAAAVVISFVYNYYSYNNNIYYECYYNYNFIGSKYIIVGGLCLINI